jgi:monoamine oxidase
MAGSDTPSGAHLRTYGGDAPSADGASVAIIGGGLAGLGAAVELGRAGIPVVLYEARDRLGGRVHSITDPHTAQPVDLGAEWISTDGRVADLLRAHQTPLHSARGEFLVRTDHGVQAMPEMQETSGEILSRLATHVGAANQPDVPLRDALMRWCREPELADARAALLGYVQGFHAADPVHLSSKWLLEVEANQSAADSEWRSGHGAARAVQLLAEQLTGDVQLRLSHVVHRVAWQAGQVTVQASQSHGDGARLTTTHRAAVVTLPAALLQAPDAFGSVHFDPPLPDAHTGRGTLPMGHARRITCVFHTPFWEALPDIAGFGFLQAPDAPLPTWWSAATAGTPMLVGWAAGPQLHAHLDAGASPAHIREACIASLAQLLGVREAQVTDELITCHTHDWSSDAFSRGAYTYVAAGGLEAHHEMSEPLAGTLFLAGEATAGRGYNATMEGAWRTGTDCARRVLAALRHD